MTMGIHREAPPFVDQSTEQEILVTGIKVESQHTRILQCIVQSQYAVLCGLKFLY